MVTHSQKVLDEMGKGEIYKVTNIVTNKVYIGQTTLRLSSDARKYGYLRRWRKHVSDAKRNISKTCIFHNSIRKHGEDNFVVESLVVLPLDELNQKEQELIAEYNSIYPNGYNIEEGGSRKTTHERTKKLLSSHQRYKNISDDNMKIVRELLQRFGLEDLPYGINFSSNSKTGNIGFTSRSGHYPLKGFVSVMLPMDVKFSRAMRYLELCQNCDDEGIQNFLDSNNSEVASLIQKSKVKNRHPDVSECMKILGIAELPIYLRYNSHTRKFYYAQPKKSTKTFSCKTPLESLQQAMKFLTVAGSEESDTLQ